MNKKEERGMREWSFKPPEWENYDASDLEVARRAYYYNLFRHLLGVLGIIAGVAFGEAGFVTAIYWDSGPYLLRICIGIIAMVLAIVVVIPWSMGRLDPWRLDR